MNIFFFAFTRLRCIWLLSLHNSKIILHSSILSDLSSICIMSLHDDQNLECPLCMEPFEMDDFNFFPCTCGYQICRFCWHRIRTDENGLCPACRKQYPEDPADFKPLSVEEWQKIKNEKRQKDQQKKQKMSESRKHLANVRVVQKNLVFVVGLPTRLADAEVLKKYDYFGKFGKIHKVVVNQSTTYAGSQVTSKGPSASAYVTYCRPEDTLRAIKSVNNIQVDGRTLKASLGTTKYCSHFLKNQLCPKTDCMYLHELGDEAASFTKEDMQQGKHQEYEKKLQDQIIGCNNRKQAASPTPTQCPPSSTKETWPLTVQSVKESRVSKTKDSTQSQKTEGKSSRSKSKSEGQKNKKSKNKSTDSNAQNHSSSKPSSTKDDSNSTSQKKSQKGGSSKHNTAQQHTSGHSPVHNDPEDSHTETTLDEELPHKNAQPTTYVHIEEQQQPQHSASIQIAPRSDSPTLSPSPISSSTSSLFTPFGSLSSNFMSSSSPSPPPSNNPLSFSVLGGSSQEDVSPIGAFVVPPVVNEHKRPQSPVFGSSMENGGESLFSHMGYLPVNTDCGSYNGLLNGEETTTDSSDWSSTYSFEEPLKPEDDLDFDPWNESSKGLADLIAKEAVHNPAYSELPTPPGFFQPIKAPVPNSQRIPVPPPGFCSRQVPPQSNPLNHLSGMYGQSNTDFLNCKLPSQRQPMNGCSQYFQDQPQNPMDIPNQYKQQFPQQNIRDSLIENLRFKKNWEDRVRNLIPDMFYQLNSRNVQKGQSQNTSSWNQQQQQQGRDLSWLANESSMLNSGNVSDGQRSNAIWMKALQQLSIDENTNQYNGHSPYTNNFGLRGQWPTAQCPPPGFVAPSRPSVNTPFQHMQVNQKI
ncbi:hypothetical protein JTE90_016607 [Oedothorax gibbosus]|uniref:CCR4-NOT transcription complex subunit 4 n=1 Tax=Oedothorax gibbosus TaxID=931172 RepID=A0AAV6U9U5_9ARAC|nr:hypothetical protein JTE90_016607 [Oedothorax gibbosus]